MRNIDYINKKVAKDKGEKEELVALINNFYWNEVKTTMRGLEDEFIHIKGIGNFEVSKRKIEKQIEIVRNFIRNMRNSKKFNNPTKEAIITDYKKLYVKCLNMRKIVNETLTFRNTYNK